MRGDFQVYAVSLYVKGLVCLQLFWQYDQYTTRKHSCITRMYKQQYNKQIMPIICYDLCFRYM